MRRARLPRPPAVAGAYRDVGHLLTTACGEETERPHVHVVPLHRMLSAVRVLLVLPAPARMLVPAVGIVLELRARCHEVVGLSGRSVAATLSALGVELQTDETSPWPSGLGRGPASDLDQARRCAGRSIAWWHTLRAELGLDPEPLPESLATWWNQSPHATLVLGLPEPLGHAAPAPARVHDVGPSL